ncbi:MAG: hypothetical protein CMI96_01520 [Pelagibacteraceae bacterium]|nr:hypothetical protein [Pelagibacteraceae bacterium]|tara:strand:- start:10554 stop:11156 length:603 start_codon:yes stop_codon:yes gene_type:complete
MKSKQWINRQKSDYYVKKAKKIGYFSRSAFKLIEIEKKHNIIKNSSHIFEFGAAPGGWSQVILEIKPNAKITAIDLLDLKFNHSNILFYKVNFQEFDFKKLNKTFDLVLSDIAPNTTGHKSTDHLRLSNIVFDIINLLSDILKKNGCFITKIWKGADEKKIFNCLKNFFNHVSYFKPESSRKDSSEIYIVAKNFNIKDKK